MATQAGKWVRTRVVARQTCQQARNAAHLRRLKLCTLATQRVSAPSYPAKSEGLRVWHT